MTDSSIRRGYGRWVRNEVLEDYSLRYAPKSFRRWTPYVVATTALGGIAYLADFAIGGSIAVTAFGELAKAFSPFIALGLAFALSPMIAIATKGRYYIARVDELRDPLLTEGGGLSGTLLTCTVCDTAYERPDLAACPFRQGTICSLCCSLEADCDDMCKRTGPSDLGMPVVRTAGSEKHRVVAFKHT